MFSEKNSISFEMLNTIKSKRQILIKKSLAFILLLLFYCFLRISYMGTITLFASVLIHSLSSSASFCPQTSSQFYDL